MEFRREEVGRRGALAAKAVKFVGLATGALADWPKSKPWLNETETTDFAQQVQALRTLFAHLLHLGMRHHRVATPRSVRGHRSQSRLLMREAPHTVCRLPDSVVLLVTMLWSITPCRR